MSEPLLKEEEVAAKLAVSKSLLRKMRRDGNGPNFVKIGDAVRYPSSGLENYINQHTVHGTDK